MPETFVIHDRKAVLLKQLGPGYVILADDNTGQQLHRDGRWGAMRDGNDFETIEVAREFVGRLTTVGLPHK